MSICPESYKDQIEEINKMLQANIRETYNQDMMEKFHIYHKSRSQLMPIEYGIIRANIHSTRDQILDTWNKKHPDVFHLQVKDPSVIVTILDLTN